MRALLPSLSRASRAAVRKAGKALVLPVTHGLGRRGRRYYFEDFVRVYPDGVAFDRLGRRRRATEEDARNFQNHAKLYAFAGQFAPGKIVVDAGCGSGYGSKILKDAGAASVLGFDASRRALRFAEERFGDCASFTLQTITSLDYPDASIDLVVCSEVLEHVREYGVEDAALDELVRILRPAGLLVLATPNAELLGSHGFEFDELRALVKRRFAEHVFFENALVPFEPARRRDWERRLSEGRVGAIPTGPIDLSETVVPEGAAPELKAGEPSAPLRVGPYEVDPGLLHNTHSFVVLGVAPAS